MSGSSNSWYYRRNVIVNVCSLQHVPGALQVHYDDHDLHYDGQLLLLLQTCKYTSIHASAEYPRTQNSKVTSGAGVTTEHDSLAVSSERCCCVMERRCFERMLKSLVFSKVAGHLIWTHCSWNAAMCWAKRLTSSPTMHSITNESLIFDILFTIETRMYMNLE